MIYVCIYIYIYNMYKKCTYICIYIYTCLCTHFVQFHLPSRDDGPTLTSSDLGPRDLGTVSGAVEPRHFEPRSY